MSLLKNIKDGVIGVFKKEVKGQLESQKDLSELEAFITKAKTREEKFRAEILQNIALKMEEGKAEGDLENNNFIVYLSETDYHRRGEKRRRNFKNSLEEKCNSHAHKLVRDYSNEPEKIVISVGIDKNLNYNKENEASVEKRFANLFKVGIENENQSSKTSSPPIIEQHVQSIDSSEFEPIQIEEKKINVTEIETVVKEDTDLTEVKDDDLTEVSDDDSGRLENEDEVYYLEVTNNSITQIHEITKTETIIGRKAKDIYLTKADIIIDGKGVSREHAKLVFKKGDFWLIHKGRNPTKIDDVICQSLVETSVKPNQQIQIEEFTLLIKKK